MDKNKKPLASIAGGKSAEDINRAIRGMAIRLQRTILSDRSLDLDEKRDMFDTVKRLAQLHEEIARTGMDTPLTDEEAELIIYLMRGGQGPGTYRLATLTRDQDDVKNLLGEISNRIYDLYEGARLAELDWRDCGCPDDSSDYCRLEALKLRLLYDDISEGGADTMLSTGQFRYIADLLFCALDFHRRQVRELAHKRRKLREMVEGG